MHLRLARRDWRIHRIHSVVVPAAEHRAWRTWLGRGHCGRIPEDAGHRAPFPQQLRKRPVKLGDARPEGLPDRLAFRRQRRGLGNDRGERGARGRRPQLHHGRGVAPHHPRCRVPSRAARHVVHKVLLKLTSTLTCYTLRHKLWHALLKVFAPNSLPIPAASSSTTSSSTPVGSMQERSPSLTLPAAPRGALRTAHTLSSWIGWRATWSQAAFARER